MFEPRLHSAQDVFQAASFSKSPQSTKRKAAGNLDFVIWKDLPEKPKSESSASDPEDLDRKPRAGLRVVQVSRIAQPVIPVPFAKGWGDEEPIRVRGRRQED